MQEKSFSNRPAGGRRSFFKLLFSEVVSFCDEIRGLPQLRLSDLSNLPDESIEKIIPAIVKGLKIHVTDEKINAALPGKDESLFLFENKNENTFIFNHFNGKKTIGEISQELSGFMSWEIEEAFDYAKSFFLRLVELKVCMPLNSVDK